jgi:polysaccharide biosynthesis/export protein
MMPERRFREVVALLGAAFLMVGLSYSVTGAQEYKVQEYKVGVDDVLGIHVWDNKDLDQAVFVLPNGMISLPLAGEVQAAGLTVAELEQRLVNVYQKTVKVPRVTIVVKEIRSRPVFFIGGVGKPGPMQLTQDLTLLQAISLAGGLVEGADQESAFVLRGTEVIPVNLARLMHRADLSQNIRLQPRDTIVVPVADVVYVQGEVRAPRSVKYTNNLTILTAIAQAGGFTPLAAKGRVNLVRGEGGKRENIKVDVDEMMSGSVRDLALKPNDIIIVPQRLF